MVVRLSRAATLHGRPRYFCEPHHKQRRNIIRALDDFGFGDIGLPPKDFTEPDQIIQLGATPSRVDLLTSLTGIKFAQAWAERVAGELDGIDVAFISRQHLMKNKLAVGRPQDLTDVELLRREEAE